MTSVLSRSTASEVRAHLARRQTRQIECAAAAGLSQPALSRRLSGEVSFTLDELERVAVFLEVDVRDLMPEPARGLAAVPA